MIDEVDFRRFHLFPSYPQLSRGRISHFTSPHCIGEGVITQVHPHCAVLIGENRPAQMYKDYPRNLPLLRGAETARRSNLRKVGRGGFLSADEFRDPRSRARCNDDIDFERYDPSPVTVADKHRADIQMAFGSWAARDAPIRRALDEDAPTARDTPLFPMARPGKMTSPATSRIARSLISGVDD